MKTLLKLCALTLGLTLAAGTAHAQAGLLVGSDSRDFRGTDSAVKSAEMERDRTISEAGSRPKRSGSSRAVPAQPEDVKVGSEVRDSKGVVVGAIDAVSMTAAVVASPAGKVEVPLESFGKNNKGLLIGVTKAEFDKLVADASRPAN